MEELLVIDSGWGGDDPCLTMWSLVGLHSSETMPENGLTFMFIRTTLTRLSGILS